VLKAPLTNRMAATEAPRRLHRITAILLLVLAIAAIAPMAAHADHRLGALDNSGTLWTAEDVLSPTLERAWNVKDFQVDGDRTAKLDPAGRLWVKKGTTRQAGFTRPMACRRSSSSWIPTRERTASLS
jgi:hypothetical protein